LNFGTITVRCRGYKLTQFINALHSNAVECREQYTKYEEFYTSIAYIDYKKFKGIADKYSIEMFIEKRTGLLPKILKYRKRYGVLLGLIIALSFCFYVSNTIMLIEVKGNINITKGAILAAAENLGIEKGKNVQKINYSQTERLLMAEISELSWVNIQHTGNRVLISVAEVKEAPIIDNITPCNIVATKDAVITKVTVRNGQLFGTVNRPVRKGQVVISGIYYTRNKDKTRVHASGEIIGRYSEEIEFKQYFQEKQTAYGEVDTKKKLDFFGIKIPLDLPFKSEKVYNVTVEDTPFQIFGKNLPISIVKTNYEEVYKTQKIYSLEEANSLLDRQVLNYEYNYYKDTEILDKKVDLIVTDEYLQLKVIYKLEGNIGQEMPILVK
jgi:similar to stage IV sporulation protein